MTMRIDVITFVTISNSIYYIGYRSLQGYSFRKLYLWDFFVRFLFPPPVVVGGGGGVELNDGNENDGNDGNQEVVGVLDLEDSSDPPFTFLLLVPFL
jgi:hypothetical protein